LGLAPVVRAAEIDETPEVGEEAAEYVRRMAELKFEASRALLTEPRAALLAADTVVSQDGRILGKPLDDADATRMLRDLCGGEHLVLTAYRLGVVEQGKVREQRARCVETRVRMRAASEEELAGYVATGECRDKAGAYAIQGMGAFLVLGISGSYTNVVGLPLCELVLDLKELGVLRHYP